MIRLKEAADAWGSPDFETILRAALERLDAGELPLQAGLSTTSRVTDSGFRVMILRASEDAASIRVKAGIFYSGIVSGCSCADDPTPVEEQHEYCEVEIDIDRTTGMATATLVTEAE